MHKDIDIKNRVVNFYDVDTGDHEDEIIGYLNKQMKIRFHSATFNNKSYTLTGRVSDQQSNSITISGYKAKESNHSVQIEN